MVSDFGELESLEKDSLYWGRVQDSGSDWSLSLIWALRFTLFILAGSREAAGARGQYLWEEFIDPQTGQRYWGLCWLLHTEPWMK